MRYYKCLKPFIQRRFDAKMEKSRAPSKTTSQTVNCRIWPGSFDSRAKKYAIFSAKPAGHFVWSRKHDLPWPPDFEGKKWMAIHWCHNPGCVNEDHIFLGTAAENSHSNKTNMKYREEKDWPTEDEKCEVYLYLQKMEEHYINLIFENFHSEIKSMIESEDAMKTDIILIKTDSDANTQAVKFFDLYYLQGYSLEQAEKATGRTYENTAGQYKKSFERQSGITLPRKLPGPRTSMAHSVAVTNSQNNEIDIGNGKVFKLSPKQFVEYQEYLKTGKVA